MSCVATPAHASESFELRIRQRSRNGSRFSEVERRRTALLLIIVTNFNFTGMFVSKNNFIFL